MAPVVDPCHFCPSWARFATMDIVRPEELGPRPSNTSVRRAGSTIRKILRSPGEGTEEERDAQYLEAVEIIAAYRSHYSEPMGRVEQTLREISTEISSGSQITSRLKRLPTIIKKLNRPDNTDLSRLQDIGGCRVVVGYPRALRILEDRIRQKYGTQLDNRGRDYIVAPRPSGYRALHMIVREASSGLKIEIQLRTEIMHEWAQLVESFSSVFADDFKQEGTHPVQEFMALQSKMMARKENLGPMPTQDELDKMRILGRDVRRILRSKNVT